MLSAPDRFGDGDNEDDHEVYEVDAHGMMLTALLFRLVVRPANLRRKTSPSDDVIARAATA